MCNFGDFFGQNESFWRLFRPKCVEYTHFRRFFKFQGGRKWPKCLIFLPLGGPKDDFSYVICCGPLFKNVFPNAARSTCLQNILKTLLKNCKSHLASLKWQVWCIHVWALWGSSGLIISNYTFLPRFFKFQGSLKWPECVILLPLEGPKDACFDGPLFNKCASHCSEKHIFRKSCETSV